MSLLDLLRFYGPTPQPELARRMGIPVRQVQDELQRLWLAGEPIASGDQGVWIARDSKELAESNRRLRSRLKSQYATLRAQQMAERRMRAEESKPLAFFLDAA